MLPCHPDQGRDGFESRSLRKAGIRKASSKEGAFVFCLINMRMSYPEVGR